MKSCWICAGLAVAGLCGSLMAVEPQNVPDVLTANDGTKITTVAQWEQVRKPEIREWFLENVYGRRPVERPDALTFEKLEPDVVMMDGKARRMRVKASWKGPLGAHSFNFTAFIPTTATAAKPAPGFILICNRPPEKNIDPTRKVKSDFWPAEKIVARGYAALAFWNGEIANDKAKDKFTWGVYACYAKARTADSWGALSAWAWGASRVLDWIETEPTLDAKHIGVVGHSRGGKTALIAGVLDARFAMACSNDSGCNGAKLNHIDLPKSEMFGGMAKGFPHWFCLNYAKQAVHSAKGRNLPYDQHMWIALIAPRAVAIGSATKDNWAGQEGEYWSGRLASPVWELYGKKGLVTTGFPKANEAQQEGGISYHLREGIHNLTTHDWNRYMDFADKLGWRK